MKKEGSNAYGRSFVKKGKQLWESQGFQFDSFASQQYPKEKTMQMPCNRVRLEPLHSHSHSSTGTKSLWNLG